MTGEAREGPDVAAPAVEVRLVQPGEGAAAVAVAAAADAPGSLEGSYSPLRTALDRFGGHVPFPDLPGASGWCFGAFTDNRLVGMIYACSPVNFIKTFHPEHHSHLIRSLIEIEIFAVDEGHRGRGAGTALLAHAELHFRKLGAHLLLAKVNAADKQVLLWYRRRGYTLARNGESCFISTAEGPVGINAEPADGERRLAVRALNASLVRRASGLWLHRVDSRAG